MPAVSSPTVARLSFSRSCSSRSLTAVRSVKRQIAPCSWPSCVEERRDGDAEVRHAVPRFRQDHRAPDDGDAPRQALVDDVEQRLLARRARDSPRGDGASGRSEHPAARRIEDADLAVQADDEQAGREARDDLAAQALRRVGARRRRALLRLQLRDRLLQRRRQERRLRAASVQVTPRVARRRGEAQQRERQHGDEARHERRQAEQRVARMGVMHGHRASPDPDTSRAAPARRSPPRPRPARETCRTAARISCCRAR